MESQSNMAKYAFFYLISLVSLIFLAISTGMIIFQIINKFIVDIINEYSGNYSSDAMRFGISALVISAPIFFLVGRQIYKFMQSGELPRDSVVRKWLTYFIMLVTSVIMISWLISVLNSFLNGEFTSKFLLKAVTALGISALIFSFYFYDLKRDYVAGKTDKIFMAYVYGSMFLVAAVFVASLFVVESPREVRQMKLDNLVLNDFNQIRGGLESYYNDKGILPLNLEELKNEFNYVTDKTLTHPESGKVYGYNKREDNKFELCADFYFSNLDENQDFNYYKSEWPHESGWQCIEQRVNKYDNSLDPKMIR
jgi:hypothetical protein